MPFVFNALDEENQVTVGGNTFTFKPKQIKMIYQSEIAKFIAMDRKEFGFTDLPDSFEDLEYRATPEAKEILEKKRAEGVEAYCQRLRRLLFNQQVSLKQDLEKANRKEDPRIYASDETVKQMELLAKYQAKQDDVDQKRVDRIKELEKKISPAKG